MNGKLIKGLLVAGITMVLAGAIAEAYLWQQHIGYLIITIGGVCLLLHVHLKGRNKNSGG